MRLYEAIYIFKPDLDDDEYNRIVEWLEDMIKRGGGEMRNVERWGKKRLAYRVNKEKYGYYVLMHFDGSVDIVRELERNCRHSEDVMKYITIRIKKGEPIKVEMEPEEFEEEETLVDAESGLIEDEEDDEDYEDEEDDEIEIEGEGEEEEVEEVVSEESDAEVEATRKEEPN